MIQNHLLRRHAGAARIRSLLFDLARYTDFLKNWTRGDAVQTEIANKLSEWLDDGLRAWDISRDAPYFGFTIPGTTDKYFCVDGRPYRLHGQFPKPV